MFVTSLRRELQHRRKQTVVVAIGLAVAIALVMVVSSVSAGVRDAQASVLESVYGVGTDITVDQASAPGEGGGPGRFEFDPDDGEADDEGTRSLDQSQLSVARGTASFDDSALATVTDVEHVTGAAATLTLQNTSFSGEMPDMDAMREQQDAGGQGGPGGTSDDAQEPPSGGPDGAGGSAFQIDATTVTGVDPAADAVGPLTTVAVAEGRGLQASDAGTAGADGTDSSTDAAKVAVLDATYAEREELAVGDTVTVGGEDLEVVGTVTSTTGEGVATASDVYVPLALAQSLADLDGQVTDLYVSVDSADNVDAVADAVATALPDASVSTQSDLAGDVTGSLSTASSLVGTLGTWLSIVVLAAAFGLAILFTVSGVNRRTRELGTLKAIGWGRRRVVGQVAGESVVQGLIGGVAGIVLGGLAVLAINLAGITLSGSSGAGGFTFGGPGGQGGGQMPDGGAAPGGGGGGPFGGMADAASSAVDVVLHAPVSVWVVLAAVGLAVLGGLLAGVVGGGRAARLRPAEALRSLA